MTNHALQLRAGKNSTKVIIQPDGNVGVGTVTPQARLQVTDGAIMPALGPGPSAGIQFPPNPGGGAGDEAFLRYFATAGETTKFLIGINNDADDTLGFHQFGAERMTIRSGLVGIGTTNPQDLLHVNGSASKADGAFWTTISDQRLKKNVEPLAGALSTLLRLRGVRFEWRDPDSVGRLRGPQMGLVAQEVEEIIPQWVTTARNGEKALTIRGFEALTIEALREVKGEVDELAARLEKLAAPRKRTARPRGAKETTR
jgi:hypothetical protein